MNKFISVVMPIHNCASTIEKSLLSVINQKEDDIELIVIDSSSKDGTLNIIEKYKDNIDYFVSEPDSGYADALNKGIRLATGEYFIMLAGDDIFFKGAFEKAKAYLTANIDVLCMSIVVNNSFGYTLSNSDEDLSNLYFGTSLKHPASFIRTQKANLIGGYDTRYRIASDRELFLDLYENDAIFLVIHEPIVLFASTGMSSISTDGFKEDVLISIEHGVDAEEVNKRYKMIILRKPYLWLKYKVFDAFAFLNIMNLVYRIFKRPKGFISKRAISENKLCGWE